MRHIALLTLLLTHLLAACSSDKGFRTREVTADDYGARWPLTVTSAVIACEPGEVLTLTVDGHSYGIEGIDEAENVAARLRRIWANDSQSNGSRRDLSPLVDDARALCD